MKNLQKNLAILITSLVLCPGTLHYIYPHAPLNPPKFAARQRSLNQQMKYLKPPMDSLVFPVMQQHVGEPDEYKVLIISPTDKKLFFKRLKSLIKNIRSPKPYAYNLFNSPFIEFELEVFTLGVHKEDYDKLKENKMPGSLPLFYNFIKDNSMDFDKIVFHSPDSKWKHIKHQRIRLSLFGKIEYGRIITGFMMPCKQKDYFSNKFESDLNWVRPVFTKDADNNLEELRKIIGQIITEKLGNNKSIILPKVLFWNVNMNQGRPWELDALRQYLPQFYIGKFEDILKPSEAEWYLDDVFITDD